MLTTTDYALLQFSQRVRPLLSWLSACESHWLAEQLAPLAIERPVIISGLARSGSTILLELLSRLPGVATHRYRDFPFWQIPCWWNKYLDRRAAEQRPMERPHQDGIMITGQSPEAMEEPLWASWFPHLHLNTGTHLLDGTTRCPGFERAYATQIRKILWLRSGNRYLAKNNYQLSRAYFVWQQFADAEFVIPIRHPYTHVHSLVLQHQRFSERARQDSRIGKYLEAAGHFEFGPKRVPIRLEEQDSCRINDCWSRGDDLLGYAIQWKGIYQLARQLQCSRQQHLVHIVRHEDLCQQPRAVCQPLVKQLGLLWPADKEASLVELINAPSRRCNLNASQRRQIWQEVGHVAEQFGYRPDLED